MAIGLLRVLAVFEHVADDGTVDEADLAPGRAFESVRRDAVKVA